MLFREWLQRKIARTLIWVGALLLLAQLMTVTVHYYHSQKQQSAVVRQFWVHGLDAATLGLRWQLDQIAASSMTEAGLQNIILCESPERISWSYPTTYKSCSISSGLLTRKIEQALFEDKPYPQFVFEFKIFQNPTMILTVVMSALGTLLGGFFLLLKIRRVVWNDVYRPALMLGKAKSFFPITEFQELNDSVLAMKEQEAKLMRDAAIGKLTTHIAHDLRSPLASLSVALEYFRGLKASPDSQMKDHVDLLNLSSQRLSDIAEGLLTKHKNGEEGKETPVAFSLHPLLDSLLKEFRLQAPHITFLQEGNAENISFMGSPIRFQRVLGNLIKNAIEAMEGQGSLTLNTNVTFNSVVITLADTGKGMSPETLSKILHGGHSEGKADGHGIGMTVVRETIEDMQGTLHAESVLGRGTTFTITLPLSKEIVMCHPEDTSPTCHREAEPRTVRYGAKDPPKHLTAMVVDDDENIRLAWKFRFKPLGITDLHCYASMEAATSNGLDLASIDLAFIDKHIEGSTWQLSQTIAHLKSNGVKKIIIASGDSATSLHDDPESSAADGISKEKIPKNLKEWI